MGHTVSGVFYPDNAEDAERQAHGFARDYFGHKPYNLDVVVREQRSNAGRVMAYEAYYTATASQGGGQDQG